MGSAVLTLLFIVAIGGVVTSTRLARFSAPFLLFYPWWVWRLWRDERYSRLPKAHRAFPAIWLVPWVILLIALLVKLLGHSS